ncbi:gamma-glutamyltransferase [Photobacterium lutimaris]|uniref:Glutathione hydrolase proenzyme n=1 Tax=Photobacterium lutimaris TaxID=388278 RepID=A0A2T3IPA4_9GAMM|nr:gamma-glutamyltransferase [Photobacterium lutimaris]PSU30190.1 gamma-glutamyltransferase [Photobacterium lutimaris]TDR71136.1 gamma-glutamyltranspeptidase/glutathione hydrolase [Photobacterium lutimaris]
MEWNHRHRLALLSACLLTLPATASAKDSQQSTDQLAPEAATGLTEQQAVTGKDWMIASANPYASEAGAEILRQGGNAIDAMVATQLVLGLTEPQSSGIGGGAFMVYWDQKKEALTTFDGRETAPFAVTPLLFQDDKGQPLQFFDAVVGGRSVGTPGTVKLMWYTHQRHGKLDWKKLFEPAIQLAKDGFIVSPRLAALVEKDQTHLQRFEATKAYFFNNDGSPIQAGQTLKNPEYANTLRQIAERGASAFYTGEIAKDIVKVVRTAPGNPGVLSTMDLATYQVKERPAICAPYRQYEICGMGPPSSGALTLGQIMGMLSHYPLADLGPDNLISWRLLGDASRLAFADRGHYMADSDYVPMPTQGLLADNYLQQRAALLNNDNALATAEAGSPPWDHAMRYAMDESLELPSTSHFSIVDNSRNVISMTTTIENGFGSRVMVRGFLLNNELTDFSFRSHDNGKPIANRVEPGKRPRSSMAPTIVMKNGKPYLAIGSPGGSQIIGYVAKTLVAHLDWGMGLQQAINLPNMNNRFGPFELEVGTGAESWAPKLETLGFTVKIKELNSGVQAIKLDGKTLTGAADPRREGKVIAK